MVASKATAKVKAKVKSKAEEERHPEEGEVAKSAAKSPKTPGMEIGAGEHIVQNSAEATKAGAELFPQTDGSDHALIKWLQTQEADACCRSLLHQIRQWTGKEATEHMRSLAQAQGIK